MPFSFPIYRVRLQSDYAVANGIIDRLTRKEIRIPKASEIRFEVGIFAGLNGAVPSSAAQVASETGWTSLTLTLQSSSGRNVVSKTVSSFTALTYSTWNDDTAQHCMVSLTDAESNIHPGRYKLCLTIDSSTAGPYPAGAADIEVYDPFNLNSSDPADANPGAPISRDAADLRYEPFGSATGNAVLYSSQTPTTAKQAQARINIGVTQTNPFSPYVAGLERLPYPELTGTNHVIVTLGSSDAENGTNLVTAYTAAKLLTPGGDALSATNRAFVVLPVASYKLSAEVALNTNFVDFIAQYPQNPIALGKQPLTTDYAVEADGILPDFYRPTDTVVYADPGKDITLSGAGISALNGDYTFTANDADGYAQYSQTGVGTITYSLGSARWEIKNSGGTVKYYFTSANITCPDSNSPFTAVSGGDSPGPTASLTATGFSAFNQTAADVRLMGFTLANFRPSSNESVPTDYSALLLPVNATDSSASHYQDMYFFATAMRWQNSDNKETGSVTSAGGIHGTWIDCIASGPAFRTRNGAATFNGKFLRVYAGAYSWANINANGFDDAVFVDCHARGAVPGSVPTPSVSGQFAFGERTPIAANCVFVNCSSGNYSFGGMSADYDATCYGKFYNCIGGYLSFGSVYFFDQSGSVVEGILAYGTFSGLAVNCTGGNYSFGGGNGYLASFDPGNDGGGIFSGQLIGCTMGKGSAGMTDGGDVPTGTISGIMENCRITTGSFVAPNAVGGLVKSCVNADESVVSYQGTLALTNGVSPGEVRLLEGSGGGTNYTGFKAPTTLAGNAIYEMPAAFPASDKVLQSTNAGVLSWVTSSGGTPTAITVASNSSDTTCFPLFVTDATGDLGPKTNSTFAFDAATGTLSPAVLDTDLLRTEDIRDQGGGAINIKPSGSQTVNVSPGLLLVSGDSNISGGIQLGTSGSLVGTLAFFNATSGSVTLAPPTGALANHTITLPNAASTLPIFGQQITFVGPSTARTITLPDAAITVARTDAGQNFTGSQSIALGSTASPTAFTVGDTSTSSPRGIMSWQSNTGTDGARLHLRKSRGTFASPTLITTGDTLGRVVATGYDGSAFLEMASINMVSTGTIGASRIPTQMVFQTATDASPSVLTTALTIGADQAVTVAKSMTLGDASAASYVVSSNLSGAIDPGLTFANATNTFDGAWLRSTAGAVARVLIGESGAAAFSGNASGTGLGINMDTATGNFVDFQVDGVSKFSMASSGAVTMQGNISGQGITLAGPLVGTPQALSGHGAVAATSVNTVTTTYANDGTADTTTTLAAGTNGQIKILEFITDGGFNTVVTVTNAFWGGAGTLTFDDAGDNVVLIYLNSKWVILVNNGVTSA